MKFFKSIGQKIFYLSQFFLVILIPPMMSVAFIAHAIMAIFSKPEKSCYKLSNTMDTFGRILIEGGKDLQNMFIKCENKEEIKSKSNISHSFGFEWMD